MKSVQKPVLSDILTHDNCDQIVLSLPIPKVRLNIAIATHAAIFKLLLIGCYIELKREFSDTNLRLEKT